MQEKGSSGTTGLYIYEAEPGVKRVDKLLPNRQHEGMAEKRFWPVDAAQGAGSDTQTVEEAEDDTKKFVAAECQAALQYV